MKFDVFISYSRSDKVEAEKLQRYLAANSIECFIDVTNIPGGELWIQTLANAIESCAIVVSLVSKKSAASDHVDREISLSYQNKRPIIPIFLSHDVRLTPSMKFILAGQQLFFADPSLDAILPQIAETVILRLNQIQHSFAFLSRDETRENATWRKALHFPEDDAGLPLSESCDEGWRGFDNNSYTIEAKPEKYVGAELKSLPKLANIVVSASILSSKGPEDSWYGFEFGEMWPGDYYQCLLSGAGAARLARHWQKEWQELAVQHHIPIFHPAGQSNVLQFVRSEDAIHCFVNDLHILSFDDRDIRQGHIGFVAGPSLRIAWSKMEISGLDLDALFRLAQEYWDNFEVRKCHPLLRRIQEFLPDARHPDFGRSAESYMAEIRPDVHETVLIAVGCGFYPQIHDGTAAAKLRDAINQRGKGDVFRRAFVVTDTGLAGESIYSKCPLIAIGGSISNQITGSIESELPFDTSSIPGISIKHDIDGGKRRIALFGDTAESTAAAVEKFISSGLLDRFLSVIWKER